MSKLFLLKTEGDELAGVIRNMGEVMPGIWAVYIEKTVHHYWISCPVLFDQQALYNLLITMLESGESEPLDLIIRQINRIPNTRVPSGTKFIIPTGFRLRFLFKFAAANGFEIISPDIWPDYDFGKEYFDEDYDDEIEFGSETVFEFDPHFFDDTIFEGLKFVSVSISPDGTSLVISKISEDQQPPTDLLQFPQLLIWVSLLGTVSLSKGQRFGLAPGRKPEVFGMSSN